MVVSVVAKYMQAYKQFGLRAALTKMYTVRFVGMTINKNVREFNIFDATWRECVSASLRRGCGSGRTNHFEGATAIGRGTIVGYVSYHKLLAANVLCALISPQNAIPPLSQKASLPPPRLISTYICMLLSSPAAPAMFLSSLQTVHLRLVFLRAMDGLRNCLL